MKRKFIPNFCMNEAGGDGAAASTGGAPSKATTDTNSNAGASATAPTTAGGAAAASGEQNSASASVPITNAPADDKGAPDFKTQLGDFAKEPMFEGISDVQQLAKNFAETKRLVGQKLGIPADDATPEAKSAFYKALGVPDAPEGYALKAPDNLPENIKALYDGEMLTGFQKKAKELNLTPAQAKGLQEWNDGLMAETLKGLQDNISKSDTEFDALATKLFGDKKDDAMKNASAILLKHVPAELRADLEKSVPNSVLLAMASALSGELKDLTGEDKIISRDAGTSSSSANATQLRQEARELQKDPAYSSPFARGKEEHERLVTKVKGLYQQISELEKGKVA